MTAFYRFDNSAAFIAAGGKTESEYTRDTIGVSVIGNRYEDEPEWTEENPRPEDFEPVLIEFLVNASRPVPEWEAYRLPADPASPMRIFG